MGVSLLKAGVGAVILLTGLSFPLLAIGAEPSPLAVPNPSYQTVTVDIEVARPAAEVWHRVGKYCDIQEWFGLTCEITSGKDDELGAVRTLNGSIIEVLVAKTDLSYTYAQPVRVGEPYNLYHGTLQAKPVTPTTSRLVYNVVFDNSMLADDAAKAASHKRFTSSFATALKNMKVLAEGGTLPPTPR